jgi:hypothetical protein
LRRACHRSRNSGNGGTDSKAAAAERKKAFADAATRGQWVAAAHFPFPGIGHIASGKPGYVWVPANYSVPR